MTAVVPPPLAAGDRIGVAAPAGPVRRKRLEAGLAILERRGFEVVRAPHLLDRRGYLAGSDADRAGDLNRMLRDPGLAAIWFARGGYGSHRIVDALNLRLLRRRPKTLIGYSDITLIQMAALRAAGIASLHGPMVSELADPRAYDRTALWRAIAGRPLTFRLPRRSVLRAGRAEGPIVGGCLSILSTLAGTRHAPPTRGSILFWEEVNEAPFRIDRMLAHLRLAGWLDGLAGMVVARLVGCRPRRRGDDLPLATILAAHLAGTTYPVVIDFPAGHAAGKVTLPMGRRARLDTSAGRLTLAGARGSARRG